MKSDGDVRRGVDKKEGRPEIHRGRPGDLRSQPPCSYVPGRESGAGSPRGRDAKRLVRQRKRGSGL